VFRKINHVRARVALQGRAARIWPAKSGIKDYHGNMDGEGFEWWLDKRLIPAFEKQWPGTVRR